jgi:HK97 family phage prohead protease
MATVNRGTASRLRSCRFYGRPFTPAAPDRWWCSDQHFLRWRDGQTRPRDPSYDTGWHDGYTAGYEQGHTDAGAGLPLVMEAPMEHFAVVLQREVAPSPRRLDRWAEAKDQGIITGWGAIYGELVQTWVPTRLMPGCFTRTLASKPPSAVKVLVRHETRQPAGVARTLEDVPSQGLYCELQLDLSVGYVKDMFALVKSQAIDSLSVGFDVVRFDFRNEEGIDGPVRLIHDLELAELSPVVWGASPTAKITGTHASRSAGQTSRRYATPQDRALALAEAETVLQHDHLAKARKRLQDCQPTDQGNTLPVESIDWLQDPLVQDLQRQIDAAEQAHQDLTAELHATERAIIAEQESLKRQEILFLLKRLTSEEFQQHETTQQSLEQQRKVLQARLYAWEEQLNALPVALQEAAKDAQARCRAAADALVKRLAGELYAVMDGQVAPLSRQLHAVHLLMSFSLPPRPPGPQPPESARLYPVHAWEAEHTNYALPGLGEYDVSSFNRAWLRKLRGVLRREPATRESSHPAPVDPKDEPTIAAFLKKYAQRPASFTAPTVQAYHRLRQHHPGRLHAFLAELRFEHLRDERTKMDSIPHYTR